MDIQFCQAGMDNTMWVVQEVVAGLQASKSNKSDDTGDICSSIYIEDLCKDERLV
jgi:hypothetical protein